LYIIDTHSTTSKRYDAKIGPLLADRDHEAKAFRDELRKTASDR
jgi:hypothetical protein